MDTNLSKAKLDEIFSNDKDAQLILENEYFSYANEAALKLMGASSLKIFQTLHPAMISPQYQPDGESSKVKANALFTKLFESHSIQFKWQHINIHEELFDVMVTLKLREEGDKTLVDVHWKVL